MKKVIKNTLTTAGYVAGSVLAVDAVVENDPLQFCLGAYVTYLSAMSSLRARSRRDAFENRASDFEGRVDEVFAVLNAKLEESERIFDDFEKQVYELIENTRKSPVVSGPPSMYTPNSLSSNMYCR